MASGERNQPFTRMTPVCVTVGSGYSRLPRVSAVCARTIGTASDVITTRTRPRVTLLHINPSNPKITLPVTVVPASVAPVCSRFAGVYTAPVNSSNIDVAAVTLDDIRAASARLGHSIHRTPLLSSRSLSEAIGVEVRLKCENLQRAGSFKIRGAMNALLQLSEKERRNGVVAFSSGNHAQGVALAAKLLGIKSTIVMPENSIQMKVDATKGYGAEVVTAGVTSATRDTVAREIADKSGAAVIPPFDDWRIIAGAGTVGLEIADEWPEVETIVVPLGGGGLLSGVAIAAT